MLIAFKMNITFGSVGDIISVCILIKDLIDALNDSRGSSAEYHELIRELWSLDRALLQVDLFCRTQGQSEELFQICDAARQTVKHCQDSLQDLFKKMKKYNSSLKERGSGKMMKDVAMKVRWQASEQKTIRKFRTTIAAHCEALHMLLATVNVKITEKQASKLKELANEAKTDRGKQEALLVEIRSKVDTERSIMAEWKTMITRVIESLSWIQKACVDFRVKMRHLLSINTATYKTVLAIQSGLPTPLERTLIEEPFILEDAIGRIAPVHLQFIDSWEAFQAVLELRFRGLQGHEKILRQEFVLQEHATGREVLRSSPWHGAVLPGQKRSTWASYFSAKARKLNVVTKQPAPVVDSALRGHKIATLNASNAVCGIGGLLRSKRSTSCRCNLSHRLGRDHRCLGRHRSGLHPLHHIKHPVNGRQKAI